MDIVSRLKFFLNKCGINHSTFADTCKIPRPTLSQLLNGRNKKVSDEIIAKIHAAYPNLNVMWLLFEDGDMFVPNANKLENNVSAQLDENSLFSAPSSSAIEKEQSPQTAISFGDDDSNYEPERARRSQPASLPDILQNMVSGQGKSAPKVSGNSGVRTVESIIVFYNDNSFDTFYRR